MMADPLIYEKLNILTGKSQMDYFQNYHNGKASLKKLDTKSKRDLEAEKDKGIWTGERFEEYMKKILEPIKVISDNLSNIPFS
uniref:C2H2-type domain-containing protein n=1 Tax=Caenorhabditis tropicalis TaxID=1561998 RepID=A0A1I7UDS6_9PELO